MAALAGVGDVTIRELSAADDLDALLDLSCRAFGPVGPADRERWPAGSEAAIGGRPRRGGERLWGAGGGGRGAPGRGSPGGGAGRRGRRPWAPASSWPPLTAPAWW